MADPVLHLLVGPNGSGKSTLFSHVVGPETHLPFVNADEIAASRWPDDAEAASYEAARAAADQRRALIEARASFATETVFSHPSKLDLVRHAIDAGYLVSLHVLLVPVELTTARVESRVLDGGHRVPPDKVRERYERLWPLVAEAVGQVHRATIYDNTRAARAFRVIARLEQGHVVSRSPWPAWTPEPLRLLDERPGTPG